MEENRIPALLLSILLSQVEVMMGRRSLIMLLRQTGLGEYVDNAPPMDRTPSISVQRYSRLLADIHELFGPPTARSIFLRTGSLGAAEMRRQRPAPRAIAGTALKLLPTARRMQLVLERLVEEGEDLYDTPHELYEDENAFVIEIQECPYCAEITGRRLVADEPLLKPVCHIPVAAVAETMEWAMGQKHLVEEINCIALGDPVCCFRIRK
jgi:hypothetical protein